MTKLSKKQLFTLVKDDQVAKVKHLLDEGIDVNTVKNQKNDHTNLLDEALKYSSLNMIKMLVEYGGKTLFSEFLFDVSLRKDGEEILKFIFPLFQKWILEHYKGFNLTDEQKEKLENLLLFKEVISREQVSQFINEANLSMYSQYLNSYIDYTYLAVVWSTHSYGMTKYLLEEGINPNLYHYHSPLSTASQCNNIDTIKLLLKYGASLEASQPSIGYPLEASVLSNDFEMTRFLLEQGAEVHSDKYKKSLLEIALRNYNNVNPQFENILMQLQQNENTRKIIALLLENKCPIDSPNSEKGTVLSYVKDYEVLKLFEPYENQLSVTSSQVFYEKRFVLLLKTEQYK